MDEKRKQQVIAQMENVEAIKEFFTQWWSVAELYESTAKALGTLMRMMENPAISKENRTDVHELIDQHLMMIDLIKPFENKEDEV